MSHPADNPTPDSLSAVEAREVLTLCTRLQDGLLTEDEAAQLDVWLSRSRAARRLYLRCVALHHGLLTSSGKLQFSEAALLRDRVNGDATQHNDCQGAASLLATLGNDEQDIRSARWRVPGLWQLAASLLLAASLAFFWANWPSVERVASPSQDATTDDLRGVTLSHVSPGAEWRITDGSPPRGARIEAGRSIKLADGEVELTYCCGTKLMLVGPAEFLVEPAGGKLVRGGLVASVTEAGHGFTIETPNGRVVDLGTEFGVAVDDFGVSEVNVFKGKVEAFPDGGPRRGEKIELNKGDGLQWSEDNFVQSSADLHRFISAVLGRDLDASSVPDGRSLVDRFRDTQLDTQKWRTLGAAEPTTAGLRLGGGADCAGRSYLVSNNEFDPALGAITVTCDVEFDELASVGASSFALLTRSANARGVAASPWDDVLASCARCSVESDPDTRAGMLRTGVKLESNRELNSISWSGFSPPIPGVPYRLVVRDDGVNVSFTVSLRDNPSEGKTVTVRSLFRGKRNHIALEGPAVGAVLVDRVEITQDPTLVPIATYGDLSSLVASDTKKHGHEILLLDRLVPQDAELVLHDSFDGEQIDRTKWATLEEVLLDNGGLQLGRANNAGHIDTWKRRPYLLTRLPLNPQEGTLTILGRVRFAENFLSGYGASFAVMTRADRQRGQGPGWENSVLQRGVRVNFWPAAVDLKHTLEVHEKPAANSISLLATQGVEVDPGARSYLFRVVDDGHAVSLTVIDPQRAEEPMTVAAPAAYSAERGAVAFESCWGSPILVDDVRIYQARPRPPTPPTPSDR
ncbi:FecR protein [Posidoniimonas polymericola]|uniref:FecR protein n=1 Tax=Posidoniimonas polymericola TaxID=2528002 RepID=A0A5C5YU12_9BACT|nr:FecR family protein [Posidoniimonas polymericola]TWT78489.1 FecR protein [Posidoniimonas polymericola]